MGTLNNKIQGNSPIHPKKKQSNSRAKHSNPIKISFTSLSLQNIHPSKTFHHKGIRYLHHPTDPAQAWNWSYAIALHHCHLLQHLTPPLPQLSSLAPQLEPAALVVEQTHDSSSTKFCNSETNNLGSVWTFWGKFPWKSWKKKIFVSFLFKEISKLGIWGHNKFHQKWWRSFRLDSRACSNGAPGILIDAWEHLVCYQKLSHVLKFSKNTQVLWKVVSCHHVIPSYRKMSCRFFFTSRLQAFEPRSDSQCLRIRSGSTLRNIEKKRCSWRPRGGSLQSKQLSSTWSWQTMRGVCHFLLSGIKLGKIGRK